MRGVHQLVRITVLVSAALTASSAAAQPGAPPPGEPPPPPSAAEVEESMASPSIDPGVLEDANSGRTWLSPTALTPPAGTFSFHDHELLLVGASYAPIDRLVFSLSTMIPLTSDFPLILHGTGKLQLVRSGRVRVAAHATFLHAGIDDGDDDLSVNAATLGGVVTLCIDLGCHSLLNGYLAAGFALEDVDQTSVPFTANVAWVQHLTGILKLVLEVDTAFILGDINETSDAFLGWYGLRFASSSIGVDIGFVKPFCDDCDSDVLPLGLPWLSFSYRSL
ncbi:MAG TPA: hypothetical protein VKZ63_07380 [Kofleriaceae bacterium]|nr:hypothetical protein [Kofleriaceae bacterium]